MTELDYAGDVSPDETWNLLKESKDCHLVDCRTSAEWGFVGVPDIEKLNKSVLFIEWQIFPMMEKNSNFLTEIVEAGLSKESEIIFICRSGARSRSAAEFLTNHGYKNCYNFSEGFEGAHNGNGHRGKVDGWKFSNLPWKQG